MWKKATYVVCRLTTLTEQSTTPARCKPALIPHALQFAAEKWGKLTDDDIAAINGKRDQFEGTLQKRYGYAKDQSKKT